MSVQGSLQAVQVCLRQSTGSLRQYSFVKHFFFASEETLLIQHFQLCFDGIQFLMMNSQNSSLNIVSTCTFLFKGYWKSTWDSDRDFNRHASGIRHCIRIFLGTQSTDTWSGSVGDNCCISRSEGSQWTCKPKQESTGEIWKGMKMRMVP